MIYISGKMTGNLEHKMQFKRMESSLQAQGKETVNPADDDYRKRIELFAESDEPTYEQCLLFDIIQLVKCREIIMLYGWQDSLGALVEYAFAKATGKTIYIETIDGEIIIETIDGEIIKEQ